MAVRHGRRDAAVRRTFAASDALAVLGALVTTLAFRGGSWSLLPWALLALPGFTFFFKAYGLYDRELKRVSHSAVDDLPGLLHGLLVGSVLLWLVSKAAPDVQTLGVGQLLTFTGLAAVAVLTLRAVSRLALVRVLGPERALLVGDLPDLELLARKLRAHAEYGVQPVGVVADAHAPVHGLPVLARPGSLDLALVAGRHQIERVVLAPYGGSAAPPPELLRRAQELGLKVSVLPKPFDALGAGVELDDVEGVTLLSLQPSVLPRSSRFAKRTLDLVGAVVLAVPLLPLMLVTAATIKLDSRGPVFFRQVRIGRAGRRFRVIKFRTMVVDAEHRLEELRGRSRDAHWLLLDHDPRVTRVGRVLRLTSLDELPQLVNVLRGEMSLVGPRPLVEAEDLHVTGWGRGRLDLTPGLTGLWQVLGRTKIPFEEMVKLDYLYVTNWSLWGDVKLLLRTLPTVVLRRGAN